MKLPADTEVTNVRPYICVGGRKFCKCKRKAKFFFYNSKSKKSKKSKKRRKLRVTIKLRSMFDIHTMNVYIIYHTKTYNTNANCDKSRNIEHQKFIFLIDQNPFI